MAFTLWLPASPSSFYVFSHWGRLIPFSKIILLTAAPLFAQAFPGPLLPLRHPEPALPPLFAVPRAIRPRKPELRKSACYRVYPISVGKVTTFLRNNISKIALFSFRKRKKMKPQKGEIPLCGFAAPHKFGAEPHYRAAGFLCFPSPLCPL